MFRLITAAAACAGFLLAAPAIAQHDEPPAAPAHEPAVQTPAEGEHAPADDHAGEGDHGHEKGELIPPFKQGLPATIAAYLVFGVVVAVLGKKAWPLIAKGLNDRSEKIRAEIEAAEAARRQAKDALESYERSLADARAEARKMLEETKARQQEFAAELKAKADAELASMKDRARRDIEAAKREALDEIYGAGAELATTMAAKILRRQLTVQDHQRLLEESLAEMKTSN